MWGIESVRRQAILYIAPEALVSLLTSSKPLKAFCIKRALPRDVKLCGATFDGVRNSFALILESSRFELVALGKTLPRVADPVFESFE